MNNINIHNVTEIKLESKELECPATGKFNITKIFITDKNGTEIEVCCFMAKKEALPDNVVDLRDWKNKGEK